MKVKKVKYVPAITAFLLFISMSAGAAPERALRQKGLLDLTACNFEKGPVDLAGEWAFYPGEFISTETAKPAPCYLHFPGQWHGQKCGNKTLSAFGYGSYTLRVLLPPHTRFLMLKTGEFYTAAKILVNGSPVSSSGTIGTSAADSVPGWSHRLIAVFPLNDILDITVHVSNYHYYKGGPKNTILAGTQQQLQHIRENTIRVDLALFGIILIMSLYHLAFYIIKKTDRSLLYFGLLCAIISLYHIATSESYTGVPVSGTEWEIIIKATYILVYSGVPVVLLYVRSLYPLDIPQRFIKAAAAVCGIFMLTTAAPARIFTPLLSVFHILIVAVALYVLVLAIIIVRKKRNGAVLFLCGISIFVLSTVNDVLYYRGIADTFSAVSWGLIFLIITQTILLAIRYTGTSVRLELIEIEWLELMKKNSQQNSAAETEKTISPHIEKKIISIIDYIDKNYHDTLSREGLAASVDMHPDTFSRMFNVYTGYRFIDYIQKLRIDEAAVKLVSSDAGILDIAYDAGFDSLRTFNRTFKKMMDCTPSEYRNKNHDT